MLIPIREPVRLPTKLHPLYGHWSDSRYFLTFPGVNQYIQLTQPVVLVGAFEVLFDVSIDRSVNIGTSGSHFISSADNSFRLFVWQGTIRIGRFGGEPIEFNISGIDFTSINSIRFTRDSSNAVRLFVNDSERSVHSGTPVIAGNINIDNIAQLWGQTTSVPRLNGVISNFRIMDNGRQAHYWEIRDNSTTIRDTIGGNDGTYINGAAADWELFTRQPNGDWLGEEALENRMFDDQSVWRLSGATISGGELIFGNGTTFADQASLSTFEYLFRVSISQYSSGSVGISKNTLGTGFFPNSVGTFTHEAFSTSSDMRLVSTAPGNRISEASARRLLRVS